MGAILAITGPIFLILGLGWASTRSGWFSRDDIRVFGKFVINIALPALVFNALSLRPVKDILHADFLLAYGIGSLVVMGVGYAWARYGQGKSVAASAVVGMGMSCSNSGFIGYPLVLQLLGPVAAVALALCMLIENLVLIPLALAVADSDPGEAGAHPGRWHETFARSLRGLSTNPLILSIALGFGFAVTGLQLPDVLSRTIGLLAMACGPLALFVIGGSLAGRALRHQWRDVAAITLGKLLLHPLAVFAVVLLLPGMDPQLRTAVVVFSAVPMMGIFSVLAQQHGQDDMASAAQLGATVTSFFTLTLLVWFLARPG